MRYLRLAFVVALGLLAQGALAQDYARSGLYATLNGVSAFDNFDNTGPADFDTGIGVSGRVGMRFSPYFSAEGQVEYSGAFDETHTSGIDIASTLLAVNARFFPLTGQIQPYLLAGMGWAFMDADGLGGGIDDSESGFMPRFGGGLDWYFSQNIGLELEGVYNVAVSDDIDDLSYFTLGWGVFYRF